MPAAVAWRITERVRAWPYWTYQTGLSRDCSVAFTRSKSNGASFLRVSMVKRTTSGPTSSSRSRKVTNVPARLDMRTSSPLRSTRTSWQSFTSSAPLPLGDGADRRLHALDVAAMVGAPDVDHVGEAAPVLVVVIGDVVGEVGPAAVRLLERPVDVVAELRGAEQRLLAVFPVVGLLALRRLEPALVDQVLARQLLEGAVDGAATRPARAPTRRRRCARRASRGRS